MTDTELNIIEAEIRASITLTIRPNFHTSDWHERWQESIEKSTAAAMDIIKQHIKEDAHAVVKQ